MEWLQRPQGGRGDTEETQDILRLSLSSLGTRKATASFNKETQPRKGTEMNVEKWH